MYLVDCEMVGLAPVDQHRFVMPGDRGCGLFRGEAKQPVPKEGGLLFLVFRRRSGGPVGLFEEVKEIDPENFCDFRDGIERHIPGLVVPVPPHHSDFEFGLAGKQRDAETTFKGKFLNFESDHDASEKNGKADDSRTKSVLDMKVINAYF